MWLLIVEAFIALGMFVFIVWWTMSSRRRTDPAAAQLPDPAATPAEGPSSTAALTTPAAAGDATGLQQRPPA